MFEWGRQPANRVRAAVWMFWATMVGWPATHVLLLVTRPPEFTSWAGHLILALSWFAVTLTAVNIIVTTDVRKEQDSGE